MSVRASRDAFETLFRNAEARVALLTRSRQTLTLSLSTMTSNWERAEERYRRARHPGLFRRLEISTPFTLAGVLAGFLLGAVVSR